MARILVDSLMLNVKFKFGFPICRLQGRKPISLDSKGYSMLWLDKSKSKLKKESCYRLNLEVKEEKRGILSAKINSFVTISEKEIKPLPTIRRFFIEEWLYIGYGKIHNGIFNMNNYGEIVPFEESNFIVKVNKKDLDLFSPGYTRIKGKVIYDSSWKNGTFYPKNVECNLERPDKVIFRRKSFTDEFGLNLKTFFTQGDIVKLTKEGKEKAIQKKIHQKFVDRPFEILDDKKSCGKTAMLELRPLVANENTTILLSSRLLKLMQATR